METSTLFLLAVAIGLITGLRSMTAPAAVSWAAHLGWIHLEPTALSFLSSTAAAWILTVLALGELVGDKLPTTPSRKAPLGFVARIVLGGLSGAALLLGSSASGIAGGAAGILGAVAGTLGGYEARTRLVKALGVPDYVIAVAEDLVAVGGAYFVVSSFR